MSPENNEKLIKDYPLIFNKDFWFECSDGWYTLINVLCHEIQNYIDWKIKSIPADDLENFQVVALQVKEKFGGLRFYYSGGDEFINGIVRMAEGMSYKICEYCGNPGKPNKEGWIKTQCEQCQKDNKKYSNNE